MKGAHDTDWSLAEFRLRMAFAISLKSPAEFPEGLAVAVTSLQRTCPRSKRMADRPFAGDG